MSWWCTTLPGCPPCGQFRGWGPSQWEADKCNRGYGVANSETELPDETGTDRPTTMASAIDLVGEALGNLPEKAWNVTSVVINKIKDIGEKAVDETEELKEEAENFAETVKFWVEVGVIILIVLAILYILAWVMKFCKCFSQFFKCCCKCCFCCFCKPSAKTVRVCKAKKGREVAEDKV